MHNDEFEDDWVSKTDLKKEAEHAQKIGVQLLNISEELLNELQLDEELYDAIVLAKRIKHHSGKRRQLQRIGKLMRRIDIEPIEAALGKLHQAKTENRDSHHRAERLRDHLIESPEDADRLLENADAATVKSIKSELKQLKNSKVGSPIYKKHARTVFRLIKELY